ASPRRARREALPSRMRRRRAAALMGTRFAAVTGLPARLEGAGELGFAPILRRHRLGGSLLERLGDYVGLGQRRGGSRFVLSRRVVRIGLFTPRDATTKRAQRVRVQALEPGGALAPPSDSAGRGSFTRSCRKTRTRACRQFLAPGPGDE